jgi:hypothetical protein
MAWSSSVWIDQGVWGMLYGFGCGGLVPCAPAAPPPPCSPGYGYAGPGCFGPGWSWAPSIFPGDGCGFGCPYMGFGI